MMNTKAKNNDYSQFLKLREWLLIICHKGIRESLTIVLLLLIICIWLIMLLKRKNFFIRKNSNLVIYQTNNQKIEDIKQKGLEAEQKLEQILLCYFPVDMILKQFEVKRGKIVDFALKLKTSQNKTIYLPIDSKSHNKINGKFITLKDLKDKYIVSTLKQRIYNSAKSIHSKYIVHNQTTPFAILVLNETAIFNKLMQIDSLSFLKLMKKYKILVINIIHLPWIAFLIKEILPFSNLKNINIQILLNKITTHYDINNKIIENFIKQIKPVNSKIKNNIKLLNSQQF